MSRSSKTQLLQPGPASSTPVNTEQAHDIIKNTNDRDMLFYEYEIVDKEVEAKMGRKVARKFGYCMCSRWLFFLIGNFVIVALICALCGILIYVNTPTGSTLKPLTYLEVCTSGSDNCDPLRHLLCTSSLCQCQTNMVWNGTDCSCNSTLYFDGYTCVLKPGYGETCSSSIPCYSTFVCDSATSTCLCDQKSNGYYAMYYTGGLGNIYGGTCQTKGTYGSTCSPYGEMACQEWDDLTCSSSTGTCDCKGGYYWHTGYTNCTLQVTTPGGSCAISSSACASNVSLTCQSGTCSCATNYYFNTNTKLCTYVESYQGACASTSWCDTSKSLICYTSSLTACNCPATSAAGYCDCSAANTKYWNGAQCVSKVTAGNTCTDHYQCTSGTCLSGTCQ